MKIHLFKNEHVYNLALLEFLQKNFDLTGHHFIFQCRPSGNPIPVENARVSYLPGFMNLFRITKLIGGSETVYFHLLPMGPAIFFWCLFARIFHRAVWIYWGADVYEGRRRCSSFKHFAYHLCRVRIIRKIPHIAGFLEGDFQIIQNIYPTRAQYHHVVYPIPTHFERADQLIPEGIPEKQETMTLLLGNSGNESNHHIEALRMLSHFQGENIRILCPLSYGAKKTSYIHKVITKGREIFGEKFIPLKDFMAPDEYLKLLRGVDVAVMNHDRQQGLGNSLTLLYMGKKVYIRHDTTSYDYFIKKGISVANISEITGMIFREFILFDAQDGIRNRDILREEFSEANYIRNWKQILAL